MLAALGLPRPGTLPGAESTTFRQLGLQRYRRCLQRSVASGQRLTGGHKQNDRSLGFTGGCAKSSRGQEGPGKVGATQGTHGEGCTVGRLGGQKKAGDKGLQELEDRCGDNQ